MDDGSVQNWTRISITISNTRPDRCALLAGKRCFRGVEPLISRRKKRTTGKRRFDNAGCRAMPVRWVHPTALVLSYFFTAFLAADFALSQAAWFFAQASLAAFASFCTSGFAADFAWEHWVGLFWQADLTFDTT